MVWCYSVMASRDSEKPMKRTGIPKFAFFICKKSVDKKTVRTTLGLVTD